MDRLDQFIGRDRVTAVHASRLAGALLQAAIAANAFVLGMALQQGLLPVSVEALTQAIRLNGAAVEQNLLALAWGRRAAVDLDAGAIDADIDGAVVDDVVIAESADAEAAQGIDRAVVGDDRRAGTIAEEDNAVLGAVPADDADLATLAKAKTD